MCAKYFRAHTGRVVKCEKGLKKSCRTSDQTGRKVTENPAAPHGCSQDTYTCTSSVVCDGPPVAKRSVHDCPRRSWMKGCLILWSVWLEPRYQFCSRHLRPLSDLKSRQSNLVPHAKVEEKHLKLLWRHRWRKKKHFKTLKIKLWTGKS